MTGKTVTKELYSDVVDRWFDVFYYSPKPGYTASIFSDITDRKNNDED